MGMEPGSKQQPMKTGPPLLIGFLIRLLTRYAPGALLLVGICSSGAAALTTFTPRLSVGESYTDNLELTPDNELYDFITTVSPGADIEISGELSSLSLSYTPTYASYLRFPENDTLRHESTVAASRQLSRSTRLEFSNDYLYTEDPLYEDTLYDDDRETPVSEADTTIRQGRETYSVNTATVGVVNQFGPEDSLELGYAYYFMDNSSPLEEDHDYHRPSVTLNYWPVPGQYGSQAEVSFTRRYYEETEDYNDLLGRLRFIRRLGPHLDIFAEYTHERTEYLEEGADYQLYSPLVGFVWDEYAHSSIAASFGYFFQDSDGAESESGPIGSIEAVYNWRERHSLSLLGDIGYTRADAGAENLGFTTFYSVMGVLDYQLARRWISNVSVGYRRHIYTDENPDREDAVWTTSAGLAYQPSVWMVVEAGYAFRQVESNIDTNDYTENQAFINVTLSPRQPILVSR